MESIAAGGEAKGTIRDPEKNVRVVLPMMDKAQTLTAPSMDEIRNHPRLKLFYTTYIFQAGQPEHVRKEFSEVMGLEVKEFDGIVTSRNSGQAMT